MRVPIHPDDLNPKYDFKRIAKNCSESGLDSAQSDFLTHVRFFPKD